MKWEKILKVVAFVVVIGLAFYLGFWLGELSLIWYPK